MKRNKEVSVSSRKDRRLQKFQDFEESLENFLTPFSCLRNLLPCTVRSGCQGRLWDISRKSGFGGGPSLPFQGDDRLGGGGMDGGDRRHGQYWVITPKEEGTKKKKVEVPLPFPIYSSLLLRQLLR